jgi:hypothetical protein
VDVGIGLVLELAAQEPTVSASKLNRLGQHAGAHLIGWGQHHLGAQEAHELTALDAEALRHGKHQRIALLRTDHGQANTRVTAGGLHYGLARTQPPVALGILYHANGQTVLHRPHGIECLNLDVQINPRRHAFVNLDDRRVADRIQDAFVNAWHERRSLIWRWLGQV